MSSLHAVGAVLTADLLRQAGLAGMVEVRKRRGDVVERREADVVTTEQQRVVLGVAVGGEHQPGVGDRGEQTRCVAVSGDVADKPAELVGAWSAVDLVLAVGVDAQGLAEVFLVDSQDRARAVGDPVVALDHERPLVCEGDDRRRCGDQAGASGCGEAEVFVDVEVV